MASIRCANCGGEHGSVAEVRQCHVDEPNHDLDPLGAPPEGFGGDGLPGSPGSRPASVQPRLDGSVDPNRPVEQQQPRNGPPVVVSVRPLVELAGPDRFGRSIVVLPGADAPEPWADVERFSIGSEQLGDPAPMADVLAERWRNRERSIIELDGALDPSATDVVKDDVWDLDPSLDLARDRLAHAVWSNSIDARHPESAHFPAAGRAIAIGAAAGGVGDVLLPDGRAADVDGGPLTPSLAGDADARPVLHAISIAAGHLTPLGTASTSAELAEDQLDAVMHEGGPARIIAPAGSGKTRVLTERARQLLGNWAIPARSVCLVAFNKRAQEEMSERTPDLSGLQIRTLNSLGLAIVRGTGGFHKSSVIERSPDVIGERDVRDLIGRLVEFPRRMNTDPAAAWIDACSVVRLGMRTPAEVERDFAGDVDGFAEVFPTFIAEMNRRGVIDFDGQIHRAIEVLLRDPIARSTAQRRCRLLLVDEFQDLTPAHLLLIRLLAGPTGDVFGVGDDDQTIYGYTGASPNWLIDYDSWFPGARLHALRTNYRCAPEVVEGAATVLSYNHRRVDKEILAAPGREPNGDGLIVVKAPDPTITTVERVRDLLDEGAAPSDIAVLTRVNSILAAVQVSLIDAEVPVVAAVDTGFLRRSGVRAALAWVQLSGSSGRYRAGDLSEAARRPSRGVSRRVVEWIAEQRSLDDIRRLAARLKDRDSEKVEAFATDLALATASPSDTTADVLTRIQDDIGLGSTMATLDSARRSVDRSAHGDDLSALLAMAHLHPDPSTFATWLEAQLEERGAPVGQGVELSTIHRVKGREWPHVVVHEATLGLLPHRLADDREEERRIFHVGITRSSISTTVVASGEIPSQFLAEMAGTASRRPAPEEPPPSAERRGAPAIEPQKAESSANPAVYESLREWRNKRASTDGVPAYRVFTNATLDELATTLPRTLDGLARISGIGPRKLEEFGDQLLSAIDDLTDEPPPDRKASAKPAAKTPATATVDAPVSNEGGDDSEGGDLRDRLLGWRASRARSTGRPAYTVFNNETLDAIVSAMPQTEDELLAIKGMGPGRVENFGEELLALLSAD